MKMCRKFLISLCLIFYISIQKAESKNIFSSFVSLMKSKINSENEISKIIQMDNSYVCLTNSLNSSRSECTCSFKKLKEFEKKCSSNFKKNQEDAKNCSEEKCEYCCKLIHPNEYSISILESELICEKKCSKSEVILNLNDEDYRTVFKKIVEFIRIFYPNNTMNYYPIENKTVQYTNKNLGQNIQQINEDLRSANEESDDTYNTITEDSEELFSPYDES